MSADNSTKVRFGGRFLTLSGTDDAEHVARLAEYLEEKQAENASGASYARLSEADRMTMLLFNMADDYIRMKDRADKLEEEIRRLENESDEMRYRFVKERMRHEEETEK